ncbi:MAG: hypothetical protein QG673_617, partial [Pseudomonadota bacterium]|nr:hypothetical protein [Pseudomonadota bacterium]
ARLMGGMEANVVEIGKEEIAFTTMGNLRALLFNSIESIKSYPCESEKAKALIKLINTLDEINNNVDSTNYEKECKKTALLFVLDFHLKDKSGRGDYLNLLSKFNQFQEISVKEFDGTSRNLEYIDIAQAILDFDEDTLHSLGIVAKDRSYWTYTLKDNNGVPFRYSDVFKKACFVTDWSKFNATEIYPSLQRVSNTSRERIVVLLNNQLNNQIVNCSPDICKILKDVDAVFIPILLKTLNTQEIGQLWKIIINSQFEIDGDNNLAKVTALRIEVSKAVLRNTLNYSADDLASEVNYLINSVLSYYAEVHTTRDQDFSPFSLLTEEENSKLLPYLEGHHECLTAMFRKTSCDQDLLNESMQLQDLDQFLNKQRLLLTNVLNSSSGKKHDPQVEISLNEFWLELKQYLENHKDIDNPSQDLLSSVFASLSLENQVKLLYYIEKINTDSTWKTDIKTAFENTGFFQLQANFKKLCQDLDYCKENLRGILDLMHVCNRALHREALSELNILIEGDDFVVDKNELRTNIEKKYDKFNPKNFDKLASNNQDGVTIAQILDSMDSSELGKFLDRLLGTYQFTTLWQALFDYVDIVAEYDLPVVGSVAIFVLNDRLSKISTKYDDTNADQPPAIELRAFLSSLFKKPGNNPIIKHILDSLSLVNIFKLINFGLEIPDDIENVNINFLYTLNGKKTPENSTREDCVSNYLEANKEHEIFVDFMNLDQSKISVLKDIYFSYEKAYKSKGKTSKDVTPMKPMMNILDVLHLVQQLNTKNPNFDEKSILAVAKYMRGLSNGNVEEFVVNLNKQQMENLKILLNKEIRLPSELKNKLRFELDKRRLKEWNFKAHQPVINQAFLCYYLKNYNPDELKLMCSGFLDDYILITLQHNLSSITDSRFANLAQLFVTEIGNILELRSGERHMLLGQLLPTNLPKKSTNQPSSSTSRNMCKLWETKLETYNDTEEEKLVDTIIQDSRKFIDNLILITQYLGVDSVKKLLYDKVKPGLKKYQESSLLYNTLRTKIENTYNDLQQQQRIAIAETGGDSNKLVVAKENISILCAELSNQILLYDSVIYDEDIKVIQLRHKSQFPNKLAEIKAKLAKIEEDSKSPAPQQKMQ